MVEIDIEKIITNILDIPRRSMPEWFPRTSQALFTLYYLNGKATPQRIKAFLKEKGYMSYRTFLKAVEVLQEKNVIRKEYGEYILNPIIYDYLSILAKDLDRLCNLIRETFNKVKKENNNKEVIQTFEKEIFTILQKHKNNVVRIIEENLPEVKGIAIFIRALLFYFSLVIVFASVYVVPLLENLVEIEEIKRLLKKSAAEVLVKYEYP